MEWRDFSLKGYSLEAEYEQLRQEYTATLEKLNQVEMFLIQWLNHLIDSFCSDDVLNQNILVSWIEERKTNEKRRTDEDFNVGEKIDWEWTTSRVRHLPIWRDILTIGSQVFLWWRRFFIV